MSVLRSGRVLYRCSVAAAIAAVFVNLSLAPGLVYPLDDECFLVVCLAWLSCVRFAYGSPTARLYLFSDYLGFLFCRSSSDLSFCLLASTARLRSTYASYA
jgi:hypothetical protein